MFQSDKREFPRIDAKIKVVFRTMGDFVEEYTKNISRGGIFLKTDKLLDPNAKIELQLYFPNSKKEHRIVGKATRLVTMSDPKGDGRQIYGVGIHFINPDANILKAIDELYQRFRDKDSVK